jgi:O-methyltransferase involved in polyketide biosynthesis
MISRASHIVLRSRFAEDRLDLAVQRGVEQYVMLGAGHDTFSVRQPDWARGISVIEVDRAPILEEKRARRPHFRSSPPAWASRG